MKRDKIHFSYITDGKGKDTLIFAFNKCNIQEHFRVIIKIKKKIKIRRKNTMRK